MSYACLRMKELASWHAWASKATNVDHGPRRKLGTHKQYYSKNVGKWRLGTYGATCTYINGLSSIHGLNMLGIAISIGERQNKCLLDYKNMIHGSVRMWHLGIKGSLIKGCWHIKELIILMEYCKASNMRHMVSKDVC